eukprot:9261863-Lingulodinium_polyedra.AAC.1
MHFGRARWQLLEARRSSGYQVYTDLSSAFASVVRQLVMTTDRTWEAAAHIFAAFNLPEAVMGDLHDLLQGAD